MPQPPLNRSAITRQRGPSPRSSARPSTPNFPKKHHAGHLQRRQDRGGHQGREDQPLTGEVQQHLGGGRVRCVALGSTDGMVRGMDCVDTGSPGESAGRRGHAWPRFQPDRRRDRRPRPGQRQGLLADPPRPARKVTDLSTQTEMFETGIKVIDLLTPFVRGGKAGSVRRGRAWARRSSSPNSSPASPAVHGGYSVFAGVGERTREGNDLWLEMQESKIGSTDRNVLSQTCMVFGQMNEPPGARLRVALSALTMAEYFRDTTGTDVLLFVDNIFRFSQAGSEVSALLGRMPSAVGYQPTLATEMGALQERIASTDKGAITSVQAVYVPADDPTDPAPATAFGQLDAFVYLERAISEKGIYPAVDPLASSSRVLDPQFVGERHYAIARRVQVTLQRYRELQDIIAILGVDELSEQDKLVVHSRSADGAIPFAAVPRGRGVHGQAGRGDAARGHDPQLRGNRRRQVGPPARASVYVRRRDRTSRRAGREDGNPGVEWALPTMNHRGRRLPHVEFTRTNGGHSPPYEYVRTSMHRCYAGKDASRHVGGVCRDPRCLTARSASRPSTAP